MKGNHKKQSSAEYMHSKGISIDSRKIETGYYDCVVGDIPQWLQNWFTQIANDYPVLGQEKTVELIRALHLRQTPKKKKSTIRETLILSNVKLLYRYTSQIAAYNDISFEDLIGHGFKCLVDAIDKYKPNKAFLSTYIVTILITRLPDIARHIRNQVTTHKTHFAHDKPLVMPISVLINLNKSSYDHEIPEEEAAFLIDAQPTPSENAEHMSIQELGEGAYEILETDKDFSDKERTIMKMWFVEGARNIDIAKTLHVSKSNVWGLKNRVLLRLRRKLLAKYRNQAEMIDEFGSSWTEDVF